MIGTAIAILSSKLTWIGLGLGSIYFGKKYIDPVVQAAKTIGEISAQNNVILTNIKSVADLVIKPLTAEISKVIGGSQAVIEQLKIILSTMNQEIQLTKAVLSRYIRIAEENNLTTQTKLDNLQQKVEVIDQKLDQALKPNKSNINNNNVPEKIEGHGLEKDLGQGSGKDDTNPDGGVGLLIENNSISPSLENISSSLSIERPINFSAEPSMAATANVPNNSLIETVSSNSEITNFSNINFELVSDMLSALENPLAVQLPLTIDGSPVVMSSEQTISGLGNWSNPVFRNFMELGARKIMVGATNTLLQEKAALLMLCKPEQSIEILQKYPVLEWQEQPLTIMASKVTSEVVDNPISKEILTTLISTGLSLGDPQLYYGIRTVVNSMLTLLGNKSRSYTEENSLHEGGLTKTDLLAKHIGENPGLVTWEGEEKLNEDLVEEGTTLSAFKAIASS